MKCSWNNHTQMIFYFINYNNFNFEMIIENKLLFCSIKWIHWCGIIFKGFLFQCVKWWWLLAEGTLLPFLIFIMEDRERIDQKQLVLKKKHFIAWQQYIYQILESFGFAPLKNFNGSKKSFNQNRICAINLVEVN